jgi:excisionase family DNA binding protein
MTQTRPGGPLSTDDTPGAVLSVDEAARFLGCDRKTVYAAIARNDLPALKLGRRLFVSQIVLERMLRGDRA